MTGLVFFGAFLALQIETQTQDGRYTPVPACGVMAGYSLLQCYGVNVDLTPIEVEEAFERQLPVDANLAHLSMADLRKGLTALSLPTEAICVDSGRLKALDPPCILFFQPGSGVGDVRWENGHYLTLVKFAGERAIIVDWVDWIGSPSRHLPISELQEEWTGEAIVYAGSNSRRSYLRAAGVLGFVLLAGLAGFAVRQRLARLGVTIFALALISGCSRVSAPEAGQPTPPTLVFDQPVAIKGTVAADRPITHDFTFRAWARGAVTITAIHTSCACASPSSNFIGRRLIPGTEHTLPIQIRPQKENFSTTQTVRIETSPPSGSPIALAVQYQVESGPEPATRNLVAMSRVDTIPETVLHLVDRRKVNDPVIRLDKEKSYASDFDIEGIDFTTQIERVNQNRTEKVAVDTMSVKLRGRKVWPVGDHQGVVQLQFSDRSKKTIRTLIRVPAPFQPSLDRVFCGILKPGRQWKTVIRCRRFNLSPTIAVHTEISGNSTHAQLLEGDLIHITGRAPNTEGRFSESLTITVDREGVPPIHIPISGIVEQ